MSPDAQHFDDVAMGRIDPLTDYLDGAVDAADDGDAMAFPTTKRPKPAPVVKQAVHAPHAPPKVKTKRLRVWFSEEDYERIVSAASVRGVLVNEFIRVAVVEWMEGNHERGGHARDAASVADAAGHSPGGGPLGQVAQDEGA